MAGALPLRTKPIAVGFSPADRLVLRLAFAAALGFAIAIGLASLYALAALGLVARLRGQEAR